MLKLNGHRRVLRLTCKSNQIKIIRLTNERYLFFEQTGNEYFCAVKPSPYERRRDDDDVFFDISLYFLHVNDWMNSLSLSLCLSAVRTHSHICSLCVWVAAHSLYTSHTFYFISVWHLYFVQQHTVCLTLSNWIRSHTVLVSFVTKTEVNVVYSVSILFFFKFHFITIIIFLCDTIRYTYPFQQSR